MLHDHTSAADDVFHVFHIRIAVGHAEAIFRAHTHTGHPADIAAAVEDHCNRAGRRAEIRTAALYILDGSVTDNYDLGTFRDIHAQRQLVRQDVAGLRVAVRGVDAPCDNPCSAERQGALNCRAGNFHRAV